FQEIVTYLERQYDDILAEQSRIKRNPRFRDNRVHAVLYFISPTGHALKEMDIELMKRLSPESTLSSIGRADSLTPRELKAFKKRALLPFAVIGSEEEVEIDGQIVRARQRDVPDGIVYNGESVNLKSP
ncbi:Septin-domain-containing protein, partial [Lyophyllum atratum]